MKKCPYCAEEIQEEARICRFCKMDLTRGVSVSMAQNESKEVKTKSSIEDGVRLGCGMFIVLPIIIIGIFFIVVIILSGGGSSVDLLPFIAPLRFWDSSVNSKKEDYQHQLKESPSSLESNFKPEQIVIKKAAEDDKKIASCRLDGVFSDANSVKLATINNIVLREGDSVGGIKIDKIYVDSVQVGFSGESKTIRIGEVALFGYAGVFGQDGNFLTQEISPFERNVHKTLKKEFDLHPEPNRYGYSSNEEWIRACDKVENKCVAKVAKEFNIDEKTVSDIWGKVEMLSLGK